MNYLLWLQELRGTWFDSFLMGVTDFVVSPGVYVFISVLYWCFHKKAATFLAMNISIGSMINQLLKNTFCIYRPWILEPKIKPYPAAMESATGYSFPSGHTQLAATEFLSIARWQQKRKWLVAACVFMTLLVMFTRNYLGVHTLWDVLASALLACVVILLNEKLLLWVEKGKNRDLWVAMAGIGVALLALWYTNIKPYPMDYDGAGKLLVDPAEMITDCYLASGCLGGFFIGWFLERRYLNFSTDVSGKVRLWRGIGGGALLLFLVLVVKDILTEIHLYWGNFIFFGFTFVFILFIYPWIFTKIEKRKKRHELHHFVQTVQKRDSKVEF